MASPFSRTTGALTRDSSDSTLIALGVTTGLVFLWLLWFLLSRVTVYETSRGARLEAGAAPWLLSNALPGKVRRSRLVIGRAVHAGDPLVELDGTEQNLRVAEETALLTSLEGRAQALKGQVTALDAAWQADRQTAGASLASAQAHLAEADAGLALATDTEARMQAQSAIGGVSELDARRARADALKLKGTRDALLADAQRDENRAAGFRHSIELDAVQDPRGLGVQIGADGEIS